MLPWEQIRKHDFSTVQNFGACTFCLPDSSGICVARRIVSKYIEEEDWKTGKMKMPGTFQFGERVLKAAGM